MRALLNASLSRAHPTILFGACLGLLGLIAGLNVLAGRHVGIALFYFVPTCVATWYGGWKPGVVFAILAAGAWAGSDVATGVVAQYPNGAFAAANAAIRVTFLTFMTSLTHSLRRAGDSLWDLSRADGLTGLPNRRCFDEALEKVSRLHGKCRPWSLACIDLDGFKAINDSVGHGEGDAVLMAVARVATLAARETDVFARIGGDEFALLMPDTDREAAARVVASFHSRLKTAFAAAGWPTGASIGVVTFHGPVSSAVAAMAMSDSLAREVKSSARGSIAHVVSGPS